MIAKITLAALALALAQPGLAQGGAGEGEQASCPSVPLIIAHRGASGERPEHTLAAYERAIDQGADYIEPDLVMTRDAVLVARHENEISGTTDIADHPEFADRKTEKTIDGVLVSGWFTEDFTLAELRTLRMRERLPELRIYNNRFDGLYPIATLAEIIRLVQVKQGELGRVIGLYPEIKHGSYFAASGLPMEARLVQMLHAAGYQGAKDPVYIQSFEIGNLQQLDTMTDIRLIQLIAADGGPADRSEMRYSEMITPVGLAQIARYADGIGVEKTLVIPRDEQGNNLAPTQLVAHAHRAGLAVHGWTFRRENIFLPRAFQRGEDPRGHGDLQGEIRSFVAAGMNGIFSDNPAQAVRACPK